MRIEISKEYDNLVFIDKTVMQNLENLFKQYGFEIKNWDVFIRPEYLEMEVLMK